MKIAEIASAFLSIASNDANDYPSIWSSYEITKALNIVDRVAEAMCEKYADELGEKQEDFGECDLLTFDGATYILNKDFEIDELLEEVRSLSTRGENSIIDRWVEEVE